MTKQDIINLFPIKAVITQEVINIGWQNINDRSAIGLLTLKNALPDELKPFIGWGVHHGHIEKNGDWINITTVEKLDLWDIKTPVKITFTLDF